MLERFSEEAVNALHAAHSAALAFGQPEVRTEHLLYALLRVCQPPLREELATTGLTADRLERGLIGMSAGTSAERPSGFLPYVADTRAAFEEATILAVTAQEDEVTVEHLLISLLARPRSIVPGVDGSLIAAAAGVAESALRRRLEARGAMSAELLKVWLASARRAKSRGATCMDEGDLVESLLEMPASILSAALKRLHVSDMALKAALADARDTS